MVQGKDNLLRRLFQGAGGRLGDFIVTIAKSQIDQIREVIGDVGRSMNPLLQQFVSFKNAVDVLGESYKLNIDLSRSLDKLTENLSEDGSITLNLMERLKDYDAGIRTNSKELSNLTTRMRLTDQDTDISRKAFSELSYNTFQSVQSVDRLAKVVMESAKDGQISQTRLL